MDGEGSCRVEALSNEDADDGQRRWIAKKVWILKIRRWTDAPAEGPMEGDVQWILQVGTEDLGKKIKCMFQWLKERKSPAKSKDDWEAGSWPLLKDGNRSFWEGKNCVEDWRLRDEGRTFDRSERRREKEARRGKGSLKFSPYFKKVVPPFRETF